VIQTQQLRLRQIIESDLEKGTYAAAAGPAAPATPPTTPPASPTPPKSAPAFRPSPTATCTLATPKASASTLAWRATTAVCATCALTTPTPRRKTSNTSTASATPSNGWALTGTAAPDAEPYQASDYFDFMYRAAEYLIEAGHAYVDEQTVEQMRDNRGDFGKPGVDSPFRARTPLKTWPAFARCATVNMKTAPWCCAPRSTWPAPTSTCATRPSTASAAPRTTTRVTPGASTPCTPMRTPLRTRWSRSPTASARWNLKTSARFTTGCWSV
jgi:hypothetical protein